MGSQLGPPIDQNKVLNYNVHIGNRITDLVKKLKKKTINSENKYEDLYPIGSRSGILYGRAKIHKSIKDGVSSFRPILTAISTPTHKLSKLFVPLLTPVILN